MVQGSTGAPRSVHKIFDWIIIPHGRRMHEKAFCFSELSVGSNVDMFMIRRAYRSSFTITLLDPRMKL